MRGIIFNMFFLNLIVCVECTYIYIYIHYSILGIFSKLSNLLKLYRLYWMPFFSRGPIFFQFARVVSVFPFWVTRCQRCQSSPRRNLRPFGLHQCCWLVAPSPKIPVIYLHCPYLSAHFISFYVVLSLSDKPNYHIRLIIYIYIPLKYILLNSHYIQMFPKYFWLKSPCSHKRMDRLTEICHTADPSGVMKRRGVMRTYPIYWCVSDL